MLCWCVSLCLLIQYRQYAYCVRACIEVRETDRVDMICTNSCCLDGLVLMGYQLRILSDCTNRLIPFVRVWLMHAYVMSTVLTEQQPCIVQALLLELEEPEAL